ncbi:cholesterol oxidase substrate-binding domain-containing protein [Streptomyces sp. BE20]|uniref:cholesterol oxidase substrate-binding domain-containing protein n=1 Tax=Streptomyces sp. BE20 TaxID=3002525 RepID=UPI002E781A6E|nr:cholesterol oxidase substrate-binding domain-containing protein [Streptomyces sp. BE20]MEE1823651.1 cholesterol oxidase substrate-binding domain-containing protein [Streptomyces sp. BE20]
MATPQRDDRGSGSGSGRDGHGSGDPGGVGHHDDRPGRGAPTGLSRRRLLGATAALGTGAWLLRGTVGPDGAEAATLPALPPPPDLPAGTEITRSVYQNWSGEVRTDQLWTCAPRTPEEIPALADWARAHGWRLRPQGYRHTWAPLTVADGTPGAARVLLLDTTRHLTAITADSPTTVRVQTGATMEDLLAHLAGRGLGLTAVPAPGELTVGGVLAIGGHGTAVPAAGELRPDGHGYGSVSNQVTRLTAVVHDPATDRYALRTFDRSEADSAAFLVHLGRAFLTEVVLRAGADRPLRCVSRLDIPAAELFARPGTAGRPRTFADFVERDGRAEVIWFAYTDRPWLKTWSVAPTRPFGSRAVDEPYNYPFSDSIPEPVARLAGELVGGSWAVAPLFGQLQYLIAKVALTGDITDILLSGGLIRDLLTGEVLTHLLAGGLRSDLWGPSRTLLQYVRPTTLRVTANGYAILARRADLQWVVAEFADRYRTLLDAYRARGEFPVNGAVEIRVTGLDDPAWSGVPGARPPLLSALRPRPDRPEWDTAVWLDVLGFPDTPGLHRFGRDLEQALLRSFDGTRAGLRVEWSKGWAYTEDAAWADPDVLDRVIPASHRDGGGPGWDEAIAVLDRHDPHRVFGNPFLDRLLKA